MRITSHKKIENRWQYLIEIDENELAFYLCKFITRRQYDTVYGKNLPSYILYDSEGLGVNKCDEMILCKIKFALRKI